MNKVHLYSASALFLLAALTVSCGEAAADRTDESAPPSAETAVTAEEAVSVPTNREIIMQRYADTDLAGKTVTVIAPGTGSHWIYANGINEITADGYTGEIVNDMLYDRNSAAEELLNVHLDIKTESAIAGVYTKLNKSVAAGDGTYSLALGTMTDAGSAMLKGSLLDAASISTLDLTDPWWEKDEIDTFTVNGKLYWLCGDINIGDDLAVQVLYFNKRMCEENDLDSPYDHVTDGTWTLDCCYNMAKTVAGDLNGDGKMDIENDRFGVVDCNCHITHWMYAMGEYFVDKDKDGGFSFRCFNDRHVTTINTLFDYMVNKEMVYSGSVNGDVNCFLNRHTLFFGNQLWTLSTLRGMEDEFGIVPIPKLDEAQKTYGAFLSHGGATAFTVPLTAPDVENVGILLQTLGALSTDTLHSAFYDILFDSKYVRDEESVASLDMILASKVYDWGVDFSWASSFCSVYNDLVSKGRNTIASDIEAIRDKAETALEKLSQSMAELP